MGDESPKAASASTGAVFLSYASEDAAAADRIAAALRGAGIQVWFDRDELRGGDTWDRRIRQQIHDCRLFIAMISAHTDARDEGYFRREWRLAVERAGDMAEGRAFLVPVVIDRTTERGAAVPDRFRELQWTRLPDGEVPAAFVEHVRRLLSPDGSPLRPAIPSAVSTTVLSYPLPVRQPWRSKAALWAIGGVLTVALSYFVVERLWSSKRTAAIASSTAPSATAPEKSIAVLPFADMSEKHDQEYFADGLAEEVLSLLSTLPDLKVIGRTSSFQFKGQNSDLRAIGSKLGVAYVVEGSVRRSGDHVRVTAQLINAQDGVHRWSETYDREMGDILRMQQDIAAALARALQIEVGGVEWQQPSALPNAEAYTEYLRGLHAMEQYDKEGFEEAVSHFERALDLDPNLDRARESMAGTHFLEYAFSFVPPKVGAEKARREVDLILARNPHSGFAHGLLARLLTVYYWDWSTAKREAAIALSLDKNGYIPQYAAADLANVLGEWDESVRSFRRALARDPLDADSVAELGLTLLRAGRFSESEKELRHLLEIRPSYSSGHFLLGQTLLYSGRPTEALREMEREDPTGYQSCGYAMVYQVLGRNAESDAAVRRAEQEFAQDSAFMIASAHAWRGEFDAAFKWLDRAYEQKDYNMAYLKGKVTFGGGIERDPRWSALMRKMDLPK